MALVIYTVSSDLRPEEHIVFEQPGLRLLRAGFIFHGGASLPSAITYGCGGFRLSVCHNRSGRNYSMSKIRVFHYCIVLCDGCVH